MAVQEIRGNILQRSGAILEAWIKTQAGADIQQADLLTITYSVFNGSVTPPTLITGYDDLPLSIGSVIFNTPAQSSIGVNKFNFRFVVPAAALVGENNYRVEVLFTPAAGEPFVLPWLLTTKKTYTT